MNISLFGFMGVGKSSVGKIIADRLGLSFVDLDEEIVVRAGKSISDIFDECGEDAFREIEKNATIKVSAGNGQVIACGGGTVLDEENVNRLKANSILIMLTAEPATILDRVVYDGDVRPLMNVEDKLERISSLLLARQPKYIRAADLIVDTTGRSPEQVAEDILEYLKERWTP